MSESGENRTARSEVHAAGQIDVALGPEGRQYIRRLIRTLNADVRDNHPGKVQLKFHDGKKRLNSARALYVTLQRITIELFPLSQSAFQSVSPTNF